MKAMNQDDIQEILEPERLKQIAFAYSILRDAREAEDACQDMLLKVIENIETFDGPRHLRDWSWKVLRNRCYELVRKRKYTPVLLDTSVLELVDDELENRNPDEAAARQEALKSCMTQLTENARNIVRLRYLEGLPGKEVAERLGRKPDAVYKALQRIYSTLATCIRKHISEEAAS